MTGSQNYSVRWDRDTSGCDSVLHKEEKLTDWFILIPDSWAFLYINDGQFSFFFFKHRKSCISTSQVKVAAKRKWHSRLKENRKKSKRKCSSRQLTVANTNYYYRAHLNIYVWFTKTQKAMCLHYSVSKVQSSPGQLMTRQKGRT